MKKFLTWSGIIFVVLLIVVWIGGKWILSFSVADYSGQIKTSKVVSPVEITYDEKGIPQIWAENNEDLYYSIGWVHASERLFQMELVRRFAKGELAELFGRDALELDKIQRIIGFARKAKNDEALLSSKTKNYLTKYCQGINDWINYKSILPPEFVILNFTPANWTVEDVMTLIYYQTWYSHELMDEDPQYQNFIAKIGMGKTPWLKKYLNWSPTTIDESAKIITGTFNPSMTNASNSWVASPSKSVSGKALHASDPHLVINSVPGFWYILGIHSDEGINAVGISAAGIPLITMGHNDSIAYAFTVASVDIIDYYTEYKNPQNQLEVGSEDNYKPLTIDNDEIKIKNEKPEKIQILISENGPVVDSDSTTYRTIHWAGFDFNIAEIIENGLNLASVRNFDDFRKTVTGLGALDVNWTYSDINGNIGYQLGAPVPIRDYSNTFIELPGNDSTYKWKGYRKLVETPFAFNPDKGWLATCNNQIVPDDYNYDLPGFYDPYRIIRANELLKSKEKFSVRDFQNFQLDLKSGTVLAFKDLFLAGAGKLKNKNLTSKIKKWNCELLADDNLSAVFSLWYAYLPKFLFEDDFGKKWKSEKSLLKFFIENPLPEIVDDKNTPEIEDMGDISAAALEKAILEAGSKTLGEINTLTIKHPLSRVKILDLIFNLNRGPLCAEGDGGTLNSNFTSFDNDKNNFESVAGPSMRYVLDWADIDGFTINTNLGQSGNPFSKHYDDFLKFNRSGKRWNVPFSKNIVYKNKTSVFKILPVN